MIEEHGRIVALEPGAVWVETLRQSACGSCAAQKGCGHSAIARMSDKTMHVRAITRPKPSQDASIPPDDTDVDAPHYQIGDEVIIGIPEDILLKSSFIAYLMPLLLALGFALAVQAVNPSDAWVALGGATGLSLGFLGVRLHARRVSHDARYHPQVLRYADSVRLPSSPSGCQHTPHQA